MRWFTKSIAIPESNETKQVDSIQLWEVRWTSRYGSFNSDTRKEMEAFPTEKEARDFAMALRNAFRLIKHTSGNGVTVNKAR